jgi:hypothetical protein
VKDEGRGREFGRVAAVESSGALVPRLFTLKMEHYVSSETGPCRIFYFSDVFDPIN